MADHVEPRHNFACPPALGEVDGIELAFLDRADPDDRHFLILAEHPELARAIREDMDEVVVSGNPVNPRLHVTLHEIVANQLWDDDPPEAWHTAQRLLGLGYERHEVLHMLCRAVAGQVWSALEEGDVYDRTRYLGALEALPGSWEAERPRRHTMTLPRGKPRGRRRP